MPAVPPPAVGSCNPRGGAMFAAEIRRAVEAAPRTKLPEVAVLLWQAFGAGQVTETEAEELSALIEARKAVQTAARPLQRHVGSRPRSSASMERRRTWAARSLLPPQIAARFTLGETAVLAVVAAQVRRQGACSWAIGHIAAVAGVSETTVKRAVREAKRLGLISVEERRLSARRNATNVVRIVSLEWKSWLARRGGGQFVPSTNKNLSDIFQKAATKERNCRKRSRVPDAPNKNLECVQGGLRRTNPFRKSAGL
jgi:DNA-binding Lrp family transcriptional regulator